MKYQGKPDIKYIVLHHTAVSRKAQPLQFDAVNQYHKNKWGMRSSLGYYGGYNFLVEPTGLRQQYRTIGEETVAQIGLNCDVPSRCTAISYCMAGDFRVEKPTDYQVADFRSFVEEVKKTYPKVVVKQHKDVAPGRTCAELEPLEIASWLRKPDSKDEIIAKLKKQNQQLIAILNHLIKLITK